MENKSILNIILVALLMIYVFFFTYLIVRYVIPKNKVNLRHKAEDELNESKVSSTNDSQTEFYKKSAEYAEKVLFGKVFDPQYGEKNFYGNKLIDAINKINNSTKQSVIIAVKYFSIEPSQARDNEQSFRIISEHEKVPLWFVILRESMKKVVPELIQNNTSTEVESKIIPLYQQTG